MNEEKLDFHTKGESMIQFDSQQVNELIKRAASADPESLRELLLCLSRRVEQLLRCDESDEAMKWLEQAASLADDPNLAIAPATRCHVYRQMARAAAISKEFEDSEHYIGIAIDLAERENLSPVLRTDLGRTLTRLQKMRQERAVRSNKQKFDVAALADEQSNISHFSQTGTCPSPRGTGIQAIGDFTIGQEVDEQSHRAAEILPFPAHHYDRWLEGKVRNQRKAALIAVFNDVSSAETSDDEKAFICDLGNKCEAPTVMKMDGFTSGKEILHHYCLLLSERKIEEARSIAEQYDADTYDTYSSFETERLGSQRGIVADKFHWIDECFAQDIPVVRFQFKKEKLLNPAAFKLTKSLGKVFFLVHADVLPAHGYLDMVVRDSRDKVVPAKELKSLLKDAPSFGVAQRRILSSWDDFWKYEIYSELGDVARQHFGMDLWTEVVWDPKRGQLCEQHLKHAFRTSSELDIKQRLHLDELQEKLGITAEQMPGGEDQVSSFLLIQPLTG